MRGLGRWEAVGGSGGRQCFRCSLPPSLGSRPPLHPVENPTATDARDNWGRNAASCAMAWRGWISRRSKERQPDQVVSAETRKERVSRALSANELRRYVRVPCLPRIREGALCAARWSA